MRRITGAADVRGSFGSIDLSGIHKSARVVTGNGGVTLVDIEGDAYAKTSFGRVVATRIGGALTIENNNGSIEARTVKTDLSVRTSFAGVSVEGVGGRIDVDDQNGAIEITSLPASGCKDIAARTSFGHVSTELPITATGTVGSDSISGQIGSGGCELRLTDSNGNIEILKAR